MDKFIILCDHDLKWDAKLKEEFIDDNICINHVDDIDDIENIFPGSNIDIIICSVMEFYSFAEYENFGRLYGYIMNKEISIFVIADEYSETDELNALSFGCFDYQLRTASIKAIAQRIKNRLSETGNKNKLYFDNTANAVYSDGEIVKLTNRESDVLKILILNKGNTVEKNIILQKVWGKTFKGNIRVIDTVIKQLRKKLSAYNVKIITHYGKGVSISFK